MFLRTALAFSVIFGAMALLADVRGEDHDSRHSPGLEFFEEPGGGVEWYGRAG
jgi:hypothetical protein